MNYRVIKGEKTLTIFLDGRPYCFDVNTEKSKKILEVIKNNVSDDELRNIVLFDTFKEYCRPMENNNGIIITDDTIIIDDEEISFPLANQIRRHYKEELPIEPIVNFIRKVRLNPSYRIRNQLWNFIEASQNSGGFTLADDGDILAYKKVRYDYKDIYTGKFDNSVGSVVEMKREDVDDDPNNTCSAGLHFCAYSYLSHYGDSSTTDKIMLVKVNPKDVVSIPTDYGFAKARCCRYEVLQEVHDIVSSGVYHVQDNKIDFQNSSFWIINKYPMNFSLDDTMFNFYNNHSKKVLVEFYNYITGEHKTFKKKNKSQIVEILEQERNSMDEKVFIEKYVQFCKEN